MCICINFSEYQSCDIHLTTFLYYKNTQLLITIQSQPSENPSQSDCPTFHPSENPSISGQPSSIPSESPSVSGKPSSQPSENPSISGVPSSQVSIKMYCMCFIIEYKSSGTHLTLSLLIITTSHHYMITAI